MKTTVLGVDASSTRLAAVCVDSDGKVVFASERSLAGDIAPTCQSAFEWMRTTASASSSRLIALEAPFVHRAHPTGSIGLAQVNGALLAALSGRSVISVQPSRWKKSVMDNGRADKDQIRAWVEANHPDALPDLVRGDKLDQDRLDAFCIAIHCLHVLQIRDRMLLRT